MLKRLVGVITVKNNWAVQSIGYKKYLPLFMKHISMNSISEIYRKMQLCLRFGIRSRMYFDVRFTVGIWVSKKYTV